MHRATHKLYEEHRSISAVLSGLRELVRMAARPGERPEFAVMRAMVYYIDTFPEKLHHPKEDEHLFARLQARAPQAKPLIDELHAEHERSLRLVRDLERAILAYEQSWPEGHAAFRDAVEAYAAFHWQHMRKEEEALLPLAEKHLTEADWSAIQAAFEANADPLAGAADRDAQRLFARIAELAPPPVGLGGPARG